MQQLCDGSVPRAWPLSIRRHSQSRKTWYPNGDFCPVIQTTAGTFNSFVLRFLHSCDLKPQLKRKDATNITTYGQL